MNSKSGAQGICIIAFCAICAVGIGVEANKSGQLVKFCLALGVTLTASLALIGGLVWFLIAHDDSK